MTPDLTARIEELARETATGINQWHDTESMKTHCIELDTVVLRDVLSTFAASIIAEKDAEAAGMRANLEQAERDRDGALQVCAEHDLSLADMLMPIKYEAQLASLRERVRELEGTPKTVSPDPWVC